MTWWPDRLLIAKSNKIFLTSHQVSRLQFPLLVFFSISWLSPWFPGTIILLVLLFSVSYHYHPLSVFSPPQLCLPEWFIQSQSLTMSHFLIIFSFGRPPLTPGQQRERGHYLDTCRWRWKSRFPTRHPSTPFWPGGGGTPCYCFLRGAPGTPVGGEASLLLEHEENSSRIRLLTPPWLGGRRAPCYCSLREKSRISPWPPRPLQDTSLLWAEVKSLFLI